MPPQRRRTIMGYKNLLIGKYSSRLDALAIDPVEINGYGLATRVYGCANKIVREGGVQNPLG